MSFGYGLGDPISVLQLAERVATEIRNYRDAPQHFKRLQGELDLIQSGIRHVQQLQPADTEEAACIEQIRAVAMFSGPMLQKFVDKMLLKERTLGHFRTAKPWPTIGARLHWSLIDRHNVDDLRQVLITQMMVMGILMSTLQCKSLQKSTLLIKDRLNQLGITTNQIASIRVAVEQTPITISELHKMVTMNGVEQKSTLGEIDQRISIVKKCTESTWFVVNSLAKKIASLLSMLLGLRQLVHILLRCSQSVLDQVLCNARMLLEIRQQMQRIMDLIEAIPVHLSLPVVRLDDALGQSTALPLEGLRTSSRQ
ncbi:hypothetical protein BJY04DRAFT_50118 [Aspergillus karnatakaensis]|uniref:uncharacterized protein n=1 Tax=Aspergillus karnatakaensis TaxID=1810916 RepID=UPI003CCE0148